jgi:hypothetical protein
MAKLKNIHPGEILSEEFLVPFNITAYKLAKDIEIPQTRVSEILKGMSKSSCSPSQNFAELPKYLLSLKAVSKAGQTEVKSAANHYSNSV